MGVFLSHAVDEGCGETAACNGSRRSVRVRASLECASLLARQNGVLLAPWTIASRVNRLASLGQSMVLRGQVEGNIPTAIDLLFADGHCVLTLHLGQSTVTDLEQTDGMGCCCN